MAGATGSKRPIDDTESVQAADSFSTRVQQAFLDGKYPGLCDGAMSGRGCPHTNKHVLSEAERQRLNRHRAS